MQARVRHANRAGLHSARPASWHSMRAKVPLVVSSTPGNAVAQAPPNLAFETEAIKAQFTRWNSALATLDPKNVAALYAPDGVLLPTVSNQVRTTKAQIEDYFSHFLKLKPHGKIDQSNVRMLANDVGIHSGVYTFDLVKDSKPVKVQARFSFTYKKIDGQWYIADHHSSAMPEVTPEKEKAEIAALFDKWNAALATLDPKKVAALYGPGAVLLPTVSNRVRTTKAEIEEYFTNFLKLLPQGVIDQSHIRKMSDTLAMHSGVYTFSLVKDKKPVSVTARFSYTYKKFDGEWKIIDHHSSAMPEPVTAPAAARAVPAKPADAGFPKWLAVLLAAALAWVVVKFVRTVVLKAA